ncbi:SDR family NAD(P)-dependent oxidoreductase [Verrucomicrobiales bacterium]|jgi:NADP-dependent 3-hydroxy acid dehydrogenase YdfG|nr:SDR family NAD(P)-dependent oxidoreductase [Verrucomicrobiales bacterium]
MNNRVNLAGKRAIITGASSGIGFAIAKELARNGVSVALLARRERKLEENVREIVSNGGVADFVTVDLCDEEANCAAIAAAASKLDGLDILINAAGMAKQANLSDGDYEDWKAMLNLNVIALAVATREALPYFPKDGGHIVNISSMSGHRVPGKGGFYSATKFAVRAMTEGLRQELREADNPTRVSSISPGFVNTELLDHYFGGESSAYERIGHPILQPEEIADLVLHQLTMPKSAEVTDILVRPTAQRT